MPNEVVGWHHQLHGCEFEQAPGVGGGQGSLVCCSPWGHKELDMTELLNWTGLYNPWNSSGQNIGVGSCSLLQCIFPTQGSNPGLSHCRIFYQLSHQGSPGILEWVACPFSSGSFRPRNRTGVSCIASGSFSSWTTNHNHNSKTVRHGQGGQIKMVSAVATRRPPSLPPPRDSLRGDFPSVDCPSWWRPPGNP